VEPYGGHAPSIVITLTLTRTPEEQLGHRIRYLFWGMRERTWGDSTSDFSKRVVALLNSLLASCSRLAPDIMVASPDQVASLGFGIQDARLVIRPEEGLRLEMRRAAEWGRDLTVALEVHLLLGLRRAIDHLHIFDGLKDVEDWTRVAVRADPPLHVVAMCVGRIPCEDA
jgi:hypothetical protein